jgi:hypothetical protein
MGKSTENNTIWVVLLVADVALFAVFIYTVVLTP